MKKSLLVTLIAVFAMVIFALGCKKEENANTDTAATDTGVTSSTMGTSSTSMTSTTGTGMTSTNTSGTAGTMSTMATTGTTTSGTMAPPGGTGEKKAAAPKKKAKTKSY